VQVPVCETEPFSTDVEPSYVAPEFAVADVERSPLRLPSALREALRVVSALPRDPEAAAPP